MRHAMHKTNIRLLVVVVAAALLMVLLSPHASAATASGTCGDNLSWELNEDTLTIAGSGDMYDYPESTMAPWYPYREQIARVSLPDGLTRVGDLAFYECSALESVSLPDSVREVGWFAFAKCENITMLDLGSGLQTIEEAGFRECSRLAAVRLPSSLQRMDFQAFYRCESLTAVTIPSSVTQMGMTTFGYCFDLVRADVEADIAVLPDWTFYGCSRLTDVSLPSSLVSSNKYAFYGCESLSNVEYFGSSSDRIRQDIDRDLEAFENFSVVGSYENPNSTSNTVYEEQGDDLVANTTTTTQTDHANLGANITATYPNGNLEGNTSSADVTITIENPEGWNEVLDELNEIVDDNDTTHVNVYIKGESSLPQDALNDLSEKNVTVSVQTSSGSSWQVDLSQIAIDSVEGEFDLSYERSPASEEQTAQLGNADGYRIKFDKDVQINAEVMIKLPTEHARQNAYLYQMDGNELVRLQASVVDHEGYAHFYLASVSAKTEYVIGINVPNESADDAIIPQNMQEEFDITDTIAPVDYVITGRTSSWGMDIGQVTWIMIGVLGGSVVIIGVALYLLNKRKLKRGYVPNLEDEM